VVSMVAPVAVSPGCSAAPHVTMTGNGPSRHHSICSDAKRTWRPNGPPERFAGQGARPGSSGQTYTLRRSSDKLIVDTGTYSTRYPTQNQVAARSCWFESGQGHQYYFTSNVLRATSVMTPHQDRRPRKRRTGTGRQVSAPARRPRPHHERSHLPSRRQISAF
jgi:hypothetical protein